VNRGRRKGRSWSHGTVKYFLFSLWLTSFLGARCVVVIVYVGALPPGVKWQGFAADQSRPTNGEVGIMRLFASSGPYCVFNSQ
jgi:hypothetical protein